MDAMNEVYRLIGLVVNNSQVIEHNLAYGLSLHRIVSVFYERDSIPIKEYELIEEEAALLRKRMSEMTLGSVINFASDTKCFKPVLLKRLKSVLTERNYVIHQLILDQLELNDQSIAAMTSYLRVVVDDTNELNERLASRIRVLEKEYDAIV